MYGQRTPPRPVDGHLREEVLESTASAVERPSLVGLDDGLLSASVQSSVSRGKLCDKQRHARGARAQALQIEKKQTQADTPTVISGDPARRMSLARLGSGAALPAALLSVCRSWLVTTRFGPAASDWSESPFQPGGGPKVIMQKVEPSTLAGWCAALLCPRDKTLAIEPALTQP